MDYREEFCEIWSREVTRPGADKLLGVLQSMPVDLEARHSAV